MMLQALRKKPMSREDKREDKIGLIIATFCIIAIVIKAIIEN